MSTHNNSRRKLLKAAAYTAPVVLTLRAAPTYATSGSYDKPKYGSDSSLRYGSSKKPKYGSSKKPKYGSRKKPKYGSYKSKKTS